MARFLGNAAGRTEGADTAKPTFSQAKVFSTPGTTTFTVPADAKKLKVFVIGAGSCYRPGIYSFCGGNCCSGVNFPVSCYCMCVCGHLTGAGGGYAEKTFIESNDFIAGKTLTINVGSIGGLSASSVSGSGLPTVTATNATEAVHSWNCTNNSSARDNSVDNPVAFNFCLPRCGYRSCINNYYNNGGNGSNGDVNRTGGRGLLIPQFITDGYLDVVSCYATAGGSGSVVNTSGCWINPNIVCSCLYGYHYTFGANCGASSWRGNCAGSTCYCYYMCASINNLCICTASGTATNSHSRYYFSGVTGTKTSCSLSQEVSSVNGFTGTGGNYGALSECNTFIREVPIGFGGQSGTSSDNGNNGQSEQMAINSCITRSCSYSAGGTQNCLPVQYSHYSQGYDYSFGGTQFSCFCSNYYPGCVSTCTSRKGSTNPSAVNSWCYRCIGTTWTYVFGTNFSGTAHCSCIPYALINPAELTNYADCRVKCINMGFTWNNSQCVDNAHVIPLSTLVSDTDGNVNDIEYGSGATLSSAAKYGGGGNRIYPAGGSGLVVLVY